MDSKIPDLSRTSNETKQTRQEPDDDRKHTPQISTPQATVFDKDDIVQKATDDAKTSNDSIENDKPTGKGSKRPITARQKEALDRGREKRFKKDKPTEALERKTNDTIEKSSETFTDDSRAITQKLLDRLERLEEFALTEKEKRKKHKKEQQLRQTLKAELKRSMHKYGRGPVKEPDNGGGSYDEFKAEHNVPGKKQAQVEKQDHLQNHLYGSHAGLINRCFG